MFVFDAITHYPVLRRPLSIRNNKQVSLSISSLLPVLYLHYYFSRSSVREVLIVLAPKASAAHSSRKWKIDPVHLHGRTATSFAPTGTVPLLLH
jgi:hypothetical protein